MHLQFAMLFIAYILIKIVLENFHKLLKNAANNRTTENNLPSPLIHRKWSNKTACFYLFTWLLLINSFCPIFFSRRTMLRRTKPSQSFSFPFAIQFIGTAFILKCRTQAKSKLLEFPHQFHECNSFGFNFKRKIVLFLFD